MSRTALLLLALAAAPLAACGGGGPLAGVDPDGRVFLFADSQSSAAFMGQPADGGPLDCEARRMNQAFVFVDTQTGLWIDSVRPTSVERHQITEVVATDDGYEIKAKNGAGAPFSLIINRRPDGASISWDGARAETYKRCPIPQA